MTSKEIKAARQEAVDRLSRYRQNYLKKVQAMYAEMDRIQSLCKHAKKTFNPDPSGNNDSFYSCDLCGKDLGR